MKNNKNSYKQYYQYLNENDKFGKEGDDWVRPGSDLEPGMKIGGTNFPHGMGYPNYKPRVDDIKDFEETCELNHIVDVPLEHSDEDAEKRKQALYAYIKKKQPDFYNKFKDFIEDEFKNYSSTYDIISDFRRWLPFSIENPEHPNVSSYLRAKATPEDIEVVNKIDDIDYKLYSLIHHRDDATNELNFPLYVSLYDITRALGGYEEGGWWYDSYELKNSIEVKSPSEVLPAAEKLYNEISYFDGKPRIVIEKHKGSQSEKEPPTYS